MQNCANKASRISSASAAPVISSRAPRAARKSTAMYSGARPPFMVPIAKSHEARARRRQSRWRALIATPLSGCKCCSRNFPDDHFLQTLKSFFRETADPQRIDARPIGMLMQIALVEEHESRLLGRVVLFESGWLRDAAIQHLRSKVSARERFFCPRNSFALDLVGLIPADRRYRADASGMPRRLITSSIVSRVVPVVR